MGAEVGKSLEVLIEVMIGLLVRKVLCDILLVEYNIILIVLRGFFAIYCIVILLINQIRSVYYFKFID